MSLGSILKSVGDWFSKVFKNLETDIVPVAVTITEAVKTAITGSVADWVAQIIDGLAKSGIAEEVLAALRKYIPEVLAAELAIEGLPENPTGDDILAFENRVLAAFNVTDQHSKLYTTLAAQLITKLQALVNKGDITFADAVALAESVYQDYLNDKQTTEVE